MKSILKNIISFIIFFIVIISSVNVASNIDKKGRVYEETIRPTAEAKVDPDKISNALRKKVDVFSRHDVEKNIFSSQIIAEESINEIKIDGYTKIRNTPSITNVEDGTYETIYDEKYDRLRLKIKDKEKGEYYANNGFFRVGGKIYYFDENGLMVLGKAIDSSGEEFNFSIETGELLN